MAGNVISLMLQNTNLNLKRVNNTKSDTAEKLSSGYKINRAADNAAGLAISEKMRSQIRGLDQGAENVQQGISLLQVADGALNEVHAMLQRMDELAVKAANDVNEESDRATIQNEIDQLVQEIDHIATNTQFNKKPLFMGTDMTVGDGNYSYDDIPFSEISLGGVSLGNSPITAGGTGRELALSAGTSPTSEYGALSWNLIYGSGGTSCSSIRINNSQVIELSSMEVSDYTYDGSTQTWSRLLTAPDIGISVRQIIQLQEKNVSDTEQYYNISYEVINNSGSDATVDFMFHVDTAYNNNDRVEQYFTDGDLMERYCVYSTDPGYTSLGLADVYNTIPDSFSIVNSEQALAFSERIVIDGSNKPDTISVGHYYSIREWSYYSNLTSNLGASTRGADLGYSMIWTGDMLADGTSTSYSLQYGIAATATDTNLDGVDIVYDDRYIVEHDAENNIWIQAGANAGEAILITIDEMDSETLGIDRIQADSFQTAGEAITSIQKAIYRVSQMRGKLGAQQNRLEYAHANNLNTSENVQSSESQIRDADVAAEMMDYSKNRILSEAAQAIQAQGQNSLAGVLKLLER
ncbi:flagellin N-terminal helical domain-containing protein [Konateibacter massiliensis]|uniref:flagellin N-terminal helical domain-containing protein n=1 Tax=Konateibacter massiliensis TaxID=2002841 RepID=UPI000C161C1F|nr:flagellin [Konateibacter massiliensis]